MQGLQKNSTFVSTFHESDDFIPSNNNYDLAIVGSGISCAYTLTHYLSLLSEKLAAIEDKTAIRTIRVAVFDKSGEFWRGIPYGSRSGKQALIITPLKEFLPAPERNLFIDWLKANNQLVLNSLESRSGDLNRKWLNSYRQAIEQDDWDELFVPRYLFGWYLQERVSNLLESASAQNYVRCEEIAAEIDDVQKLDRAYQIETTDREQYLAAKVVLAIGSPPNKAAFARQLEILEQSSQNENLCCITNMYEPSQDESIERIHQHLVKSSADSKQVLIVGSNASALETIYSLNNRSEVAKLIDRYIVISPSGEFPHRIIANPAQTDFVPQQLDLLIQQSNFTAKQIYEAAREDVLTALADGETIDGTYGIISQRVIAALNLLSYEEQKQFVIKYGIKIGKFQRRAGSDYLNIAEKLIFEGKLQFIKGKFAGTIPLGNRQTGFEFVTRTSTEIEVFSDSIQVIINCAGFQNLTKSSSPLINNLIQRGICTPNDSLGGFEMNENFETSENFYLMGPLVAGNINQKLKVWHAESCGRIFNLSQNLANVLI